MSFGTENGKKKNEGVRFVVIAVAVLDVFLCWMNPNSSTESTLYSEEGDESKR